MGFSQKERDGTSMYLSSGAVMHPSVFSAGSTGRHDDFEMKALSVLALDYQIQEVPGEHLARRLRRRRSPALRHGLDGMACRSVEWRGASCLAVGESESSPSPTTEVCE